VPLRFLQQAQMSVPCNAMLVPFREVIIPSDPAEAHGIQDLIEELLRPGASDHDVFSIKLALEEALINAIKHGNGLDRNKKVSVSYRILPDRFEVEIRDEGAGFDPADVPDPTAIENLERPCGRGLMLMRHYMTEVVYTPPGNSVRMSKRFRNNSKA